MKGDEEWCPTESSLGISSHRGVISLERGLAEPVPEGVDLELEVVVPLHRHVLPVHLRDIELP